MDSTFKMYQRLMPFKVSEILFVSSPYDAFIMEEDGALMEDVLTSYKGVGLINPPRFTVVSTAEEALVLLRERPFDLVVTMPRFFGMDAITLGTKIKEIDPDLAVVLLIHNLKSLKEVSEEISEESIDKVFVWSGNRSIMLAIIKWCEDKRNVAFDTKTGMVRVLILVEDSPYYYSSLLPILYESVVKQTQKILDESINEEHRLMKLRARTKVLLASNYEEGMVLYMKYKPYTIGIFSDVRYERNNEIDAEAGFTLIKKIREDSPNLPGLLLSSETVNREKAYKIGVSFQDKNSPTLLRDLKGFFIKNLGFGDFVFRMPDGTEIGRAQNLIELEKKLGEISEISFEYHLINGHFVNWFMARSEIFLASRLKQLLKQGIDFENLRCKIISYIHDKRVLKKRGIVAHFKAYHFEDELDFVKIGDGSLGGKARGLAFMGRYIQQNLRKFSKFKKINISIPKTIVLTTDCYDDFIVKNDLENFIHHIDCEDSVIAERFLETELPFGLMEDLRVYLSKVNMPLAVRSSGLLEDSKYQPFAGLYKTYMLSNNDPNLDVRLGELAKAIKLVFASVFYAGPKAFSRTTLSRTEEEKMAVVIQHLVGEQYGDYFYPSLSGTAQSYNYYPIQYMKSEEGIAQIGIGFGKVVVEGGQALRFSPAYPKFLPQFATVDDMLKNSQQHFYALKITNENRELLIVDDERNLAKREIYDAIDEFPVKSLSSSFDPQNNMIRDSFRKGSIPVMLFAKLLKHDNYELAEFLATLLPVAQKGLGCEVELEFAVILPKNPNDNLEFYLLQARPMVTGESSCDVSILEEDIEDSICFSSSTLGRGEFDDIEDIVLVKKDKFDIKNTVVMTKEVSRMNALLEKEDRKYLLVGPGRWGSSDRCLGIPVGWEDISGVGAIVEANIEGFNPDPSQGTHFFHNLTSLGIPYFTIHSKSDFFNWDYFDQFEVHDESENLIHIRLKEPVLIQIDGKKNSGIILPTKKEPIDEFEEY